MNTKECVNTRELSELPEHSVIQFRGVGYGILVWQLDGEWFSAGDPDPVPTDWFPSEAFPATILWTPTDDA